MSSMSPRLLSVLSSQLGCINNVMMLIGTLISQHGLVDYCSQHFHLLWVPKQVVDIAVT